LDVGKAEVVRDVCDGVAKLVGELDFLVVGELLLPELAVGYALLEVWVGEEVQPVEARRSFLVRSVTACRSYRIQGVHTAMPGSSLSR